MGWYSYAIHNHSCWSYYNKIIEWGRGCIAGKSLDGDLEELRGSSAKGIGV